MARFRGTLSGNANSVSRLGHQRMYATVNGWTGGVSVTLEIEDGKDTATVWLTNGSAPNGGRYMIWHGPIENMDAALAQAGKV